jgi:hypothetical protein
MLADMTTATRSVAVVATRLPNIDRRALSQAWYSALHVAQPAARGATTHPSTPTLPAGTVRRPARPDAGRIANVGGAPGRTAPLTRLAPSGPLVVERRVAAGELACRIERAIARQIAKAPVRSAAVAIEAGSGRVHLLVQTDGITTRIVALCAPHLRERVDRALAQARFALAASGTRIVVTP